MKQRVLLLPALLLAFASIGCAANSDSDDIGGKADDPNSEDEDGTFDDGSGIGCIFGDHLVTMARMADLEVSDADPLNIDSELTAIQEEQLLDAAKRQTDGFADIEDLEDVFDVTDDGEIDFRTVTDIAHERNFHLYVYFAGDTAVGSIYYSKSLRVAGEIGDGEIGDCDAGFSNFDDLPFFYVN